MAEEFQAGIFGGNWWNPTRSLFSGAAASPCSLGLGSDVAGFGWPSHDSIIDNMSDNNNNNKARSNNSSGETNHSVCESPNIAFQEVLQKPNNNQISSPICGTNNSLMGFGLSPSDLSEPNLVRSNGRTSESSDVYAMLQEDQQIQAALSSGFPVSSGSYGYSPAALLQSLFSDEPHHQNPFPGNNYSSNNATASDWSRNVSMPPKQLSNHNHNHNHGGLHFSNDTPFWNASEQVIGSQIRPSLNFPPAQLHHQYATQTFDQKPKSINNIANKASNMMSNKDQRSLEIGSSCGVNKSSTGNEQPAFKRARIETPSPLPTFKVRKEKLGDRITALQQLVSPFGKTDTASVLHEAIEYIKFLHDQVSVLSTPYMKNGAPSVQAHQQGSNKFMKNQEIAKQDLKSRGLCLVPVSSTFPVANETTADFWTPTFGGTFR